MNAQEFVDAFKYEKELILAAYVGGDDSEVSIHIKALGLSQEKKAELNQILSLCLTDAFYSILMGLDGAASLGTVQQAYTIIDEKGVVITRAGDGSLEGPAFSAFRA
jgi:hypothetical protein